jgi:FtsZ-binding cell division protein ZapB
MESNQKSENKKINVWMIFAILLLLSNIVTIYFLNEKQNVVEFYEEKNTGLENEKSALQDELSEMLAQYEGMETENLEMKTQIEEQQEKIKELLKKVEKHKDDAYIISKLKKETELLRNIMKGYLVTIDSLNTANQTLIAEKIQINKQLSTQKESNKLLQQENTSLAEKVKIGSRINTKNMIAIGQRVKGNNVHRETNRADRADKLRCCFTLEANEIAKAGDKKVYLRIINPEGIVLADEQAENNMFEYNGVRGLFSTVKDIYYENREIDICMYWLVKENEVLKPGKYLIEAYTDGLDIGTTELILK